MKVSNSFPSIDKTVPLFINWDVREGIFVNEKKFFDMLSAGPFSAVVYTASCKVLQELNCQKLICAKLYDEWVGLPEKTQVRMAANVHTKLYWFHREVWVGSFNLVQPGSWHNLMVRVSDSQAESLRLYFKRLWQLAKPYDQSP